MTPQSEPGRDTRKEVGDGIRWLMRRHNMSATDISFSGMWKRIEKCKINLDLLAAKYKIRFKSTTNHKNN